MVMLWVNFRGNQELNLELFSFFIKEVSKLSNLQGIEILLGITLADDNFC